MGLLLVRFCGVWDISIPDMPRLAELGYKFLVRIKLTFIRLDSGCISHLGEQPGQMSSTTAVITSDTKHTLVVAKAYG